MVFSHIEVKVAEWFEGLSYVADSARLGFDPAVRLLSFFTARGMVGWQNSVRGRTRWWQATLIALISSIGFNFLLFLHRLI